MVGSATFDSRGVKKLERVETARLPISKTETYAILPVSQFTSMVADFRVSSWIDDITGLRNTFANFGSMKFGVCYLYSPPPPL